MSDNTYNISVERLEEIIYNAPWLIDEKFIVSNIKGDMGNGRHIGISFNKNRFIKLLFKDTRNNRPAIVDIVNGKIEKENIAEVMFYRAILISTTEENRKNLETEFGNSYYCPRLIIVGESADTDMYVSANLAGIEILTYGNLTAKNEINFDNLEKIDERIRTWKAFKASGEATLEERDNWVENLYYKIDSIVYDMNISSLSISKLYRTNAKFFWVEGMVFPFLNIGFTYNNEYLAGIYEYFTTETPYSTKSIYFDFVVPCLYYDYEDYGKDEEVERKIKETVERMITDNGYPIIKFEYGQVTIKIKRSILANEEELSTTLKDLIKLALEIVKQTKNVG